MAAELVPVTGNGGATPKRLGGVTGRGFMPGQSGNPKGRKAPAASLADYVQKQSKGGKELVDLLLDFARGDEQKLNVKYVPPQWRLEAIKELLDRGFGKPTQPTEISGPDGGPLPLTVVPFDYAATVAELVPDGDGEDAA